LSIKAWRAWTTALPGVELQGAMVGDIMPLLLPVAMREGRKPGEAILLRICSLPLGDV
jgi:hypothetical protein